MSLDVALQSVAFYVLSCSTCAKANHRRKAKAQAKRERASKVALEAENPDLYRHPSPFSTNQYWNEEIMMGPGQPKKNDRGGSSFTKVKSSEAVDLTISGTRSPTMNSEVPSSPTAVTEGSKASDPAWNRNRYQREDEVLWGYDHSKPGQLIIDAVAKASSAAGRLIEGGLSIIGCPKEDVQQNPPHYYMRNPPVNDLHPPIVSTLPSSITETRWMIQPPPSARVMEGKERINRSRASSKTSSRKGVAATPLGRQIVEKMVDAKIQRGESPSTASNSELCSKQPESCQSNFCSGANCDLSESSTFSKSLLPENRNSLETSMMTSSTPKKSPDYVSAPSSIACTRTELKGMK